MAKQTNKGKQATPRESLKTLRADLDKVEARLRGAKSASTRARKALEENLAVLSLKLDTQSGAELRDYAQQLSAKLRAQMDAAQADITRQLNAQLTDPKIDRLDAALQTANHRLKEAEVEQAQSVARVNQHIARLASALDQRLQSQAREMAATKADLSARIDQSFNSLNGRLNDVESTSAEAILGIGERVADLSGELTRRMDKLDGSIAERVYETALDAQHDLENQKSTMERRLEQMEDTQRNTLMPVQQSLATVFARLDALETGLNAGLNAGLHSQIQAAGFDDVPPMPGNSTPTDAPNSAEAEGAGLLSRIGLGVAKSSSPAPQGDAFSAPQVTEYSPAISAPQQSAPLPRAVGDGLQSYDGGQGYGENPYAANPYALASPAQMQSYAAQAFGGAPQTEPNPYSAELGAAELAPAPYDPAPYDNGAEFNPEDGLYPIEDMAAQNLQAESMQAARPGHETRRIKGPRKNLLRTALTAAALVAVVGGGAYIAKDRLLDRQPAAIVKTTPQAGQPDLEAGGGTPAMAMPDVTLTEPTGMMSQPEASPAQALSQPIQAPDALRAAVEAGNPIAQLQYGLAQLRAGNSQEGAAYVRQAASQGLPMAQYILSHLYDTGDGVAQDPAMARQLAQEAAQGGHRVAMYDLAVYYVDDAEKGAKSSGGDPAEAMGRAVQWFQKAAEYGMTDAQFNLAVLYDQGNGVASDPAEAYVWYAIAGRQGDQESASRAAQMRNQLSGDVLDRAEAKIANFVPAQINPAANGVFGPQPWDQQAQRAVNPQHVEVQQLLTTLGYDIGGVDGILGAKSRAAIKEFEHVNGLPETGQVSDPLLQRMRAAAQA